MEQDKYFWAEFRFSKFYKKLKFLIFALYDDNRCIKNGRLLNHALFHNKEKVFGYLQFP